MRPEELELARENLRVFFLMYFLIVPLGINHKTEILLLWLLPRLLSLPAKLLTAEVTKHWVEI